MDKPFKTGISVVVPVYNEAELIEETVQSFLMKLKDLTDDFEIVLIDDASTDETAEILGRLASFNKNIRVFNNPKNIGSGGSLWRGFEFASKDLVVSNFADSPLDLSDLKNILPLFEFNETDFIIVVRKDRSANRLFRKMTSYANYLLIRSLFNIKIRDFQFVQVYKKDILKDLKIISSGTFVSPEIMMRLIWGGYKYKQVECVFHRRQKGKSKCGNLKEILKTIKEIGVFKSLTSRNLSKHELKQHS